MWRRAGQGEQSTKRSGQSCRHASPASSSPLMNAQVVIIKKRVISPQLLKETAPKLCSSPRVSRAGSEGMGSGGGVLA